MDQLRRGRDVHQRLGRRTHRSGEQAHQHRARTLSRPQARGAARPPSACHSAGWSPSDRPPGIGPGSPPPGPGSGSSRSPDPCPSAPCAGSYSSRLRELHSLSAPRLLSPSCRLPGRRWGAAAGQVRRTLAPGLPAGSRQGRGWVSEANDSNQESIAAAPLSAGDCRLQTRARPVLRSPNSVSPARAVASSRASRPSPRRSPSSGRGPPCRRPRHRCLRPQRILPATGGACGGGPPPEPRAQLRGGRQRRGLHRLRRGHRPDRLGPAPRLRSGPRGAPRRPALRLPMGPAPRGVAHRPLRRAPGGGARHRHLAPDLPPAGAAAARRIPAPPPPASCCSRWPG